MYINHITLATGHTTRSPRADVADATLAVVAPWLRRAIESGARVPLPTAALAHYSLIALVDDGGLVATIYGPLGPYVPSSPHNGDCVPLVTLGVAQRSRQGGNLWETMTAQFGAAESLARPAEPWCAVALHPTLASALDALPWIGDLERCIAWAWITRNPQFGTAQ